MENKIINKKSKGILKSNSKSKSSFKKGIEIMKYNDEELNDLSYDLALKFDNRNYCLYYLSLLKTKNSIIMTFCNKNDYNSTIIKIDLLLFNFTLEFAINALFFDDDTMHEFYENKGQFDFINQLPQIIYSYIISSIFNILLNLLALSEGAILDFKKIKQKTNLKNNVRILLKKLKIRFISFFIITSIFLLFFWYYISMFCAIYKNTQIHLIKDTLSSYSLSFCFSFLLCLFPGFFRIPSLSKKGNYKLLYNLSKFIENILFL